MRFLLPMCPDQLWLTQLRLRSTSAEVVTQDLQVLKDLPELEPLELVGHPVHLGLPEFKEQVVQGLPVQQV